MKLAVDLGFKQRIRLVYLSHLIYFPLTFIIQFSIDNTTTTTTTTTTKTTTTTTTSRHPNYLGD